MEALGNLVPAEIHHSYEGALHEEGHDTLDGQGSAEDVTYEPGIVAPVRTEFKLQDDTRGHAHGEIDSEELLPKLGRALPELIIRAIVTGLHDTHTDSQSQRQRDKKPMVDSRQGKLRPRPVNRTGINC